MSEAFQATFDLLRDAMLRAGAGMHVSRDAPGDLVLRTPEIDPKTGEPGWFGAVTIKKAYVAFHLVPLYASPGLAGDISPALSKRRQGKTCFNFKRPDPELFRELEQLTRAAAAAAKVQ